MSFDIAPQLWRGIQVATAEVLFLAFPELLSVHLAAHGQTLAAWCVFSRAPSREEQEDCRRILLEIVSTAFPENPPALACTTAVHLPSDSSFNLLMNREVLEHLPPEVAPWRGSL